MAVQLAQEFGGTGFTADYWYAEKVSINRTRHVRAVYRLYKDQAAHQAGKRHVGQFVFMPTTPAPGTTQVNQFEGLLDNAVVVPGAPLAGGVVV